MVVKNLYLRICVDCGAEFQGHKLKARCPACQKAKHAEENRQWYAKKAKAMKKETNTCKKSVFFLNLPCPWTDGRLPESVRINQVWA